MFHFLFGQQHKQLQFFGTVTGIIAVMCFALYAVFGKLLLQYLAPHTLLAIGQLCSVLFILFFVGFLPEIKKIKKLKRKELFLLILNSCLVGALTPLLFLKGLESASATDAILFASTEPLLFGFLGVIFLQEKITRNQIFGAAFMFLGVYIIATQGFEKTFSLSIGNIYILGATFLGSVSSIIFKKHLHHILPEIVVFMRNSIGAVIMLTIIPVVFQFEHQINPIFNTHVFQILIMYVLIVIIAGQLLWYKTLDVIPANRTSLIALLNPLFGVTFSAIILGEILNQTHFFGGGCIILGMMATLFHNRKHPHHEKVHRVKRLHH